MPLAQVFACILFITMTDSIALDVFRSVFPLLSDLGIHISRILGVKAVNSAHKGVNGSPKHHVEEAEHKKQRTSFLIPLT